MEMVGNHVLLEYICDVGRASSHLLHLPYEEEKSFIFARVVARGDGRWVRKRDGSVKHIRYDDISVGDVVVVSRWDTQVLLMYGIRFRNDKFVVARMEDIIGKVSEKVEGTVLDRCE